MAVTGVWGAGAGGEGAAASLAGGAGAVAVALLAGNAGAVSASGKAVDGAAASGSAGLGASSALPGGRSGGAIESIAGGAGGSCATGTFCLKTGFLEGLANGWGGVDAGGVASACGGLAATGGARTMLRVCSTATLCDGGSCTGPKRAGRVCSSSACTAKTPAASRPRVRQGGAARRGTIWLVAGASEVKLSGRIARPFIYSGIS